MFFPYVEKLILALLMLVITISVDTFLFSFLTYSHHNIILLYIIFFNINMPLID